MRRQTVFVLLLALSGAGIAEQLPANTDAALKPATALPVEAASPKNGVLRDPVARLNQAAPSTEQTLTPSEPDKRDENDRPITDPTQMTGSFSQALTRVTGKTGASAQTGQSALAAPAFPDISLTAKAICHRRDKAAMLNVAGKNRMVKEGGRFSFQQNNTLYEIRVDNIESDQVVVTVLPMGKQMILE